MKKFKLFQIPLFVTFLYWATHLFNFSGAPWNPNGLFDDAAWDIYFAQVHAFQAPFQAAFFDPVGLISREVVFHYYITIWFRIFGYNLLVFNMSLLFLGFITVLFTALVIHEMFRRPWVTLVSAVVLNFFPLHFLHIFMGHRYAIAAPLMMVSYYFLYIAFCRRSAAYALISGISGAICVASAVMGKQYLYGLILSGVCILCVPRMRKKLSGYKKVITIWGAGFFAGVAPLILYILTNSAVYFIRERSLIDEFFRQIQGQGMQGILPYASQLGEVFFAPHSFRRQFLPDFFAIPRAYYFLLLPGLIVALFRKRYEIFWLSVIPVAGAFVSGSYDFRILIAVPFWVIAMAMSMDAAAPKPAAVAALAIFLVGGLVPSFGYLWQVSHNPNYVYLLPHRDVAVSRLIADITFGAENPSSAMRWNEWNRTFDSASVPYDTYACPLGAYAIAHLYLQNVDDRKILSLCNGGIQRLMTAPEIMRYAKKTVQQYADTGKDLKLIWEISDTSISVIDTFGQFAKYGSRDVQSGEVDGKQFSLYVLTIQNKYMNEFKKEVEMLR